MIALTRLTGAQFALNPDLIERIDRTPDTVITLVDGTKYLVQQSLEEIVDLVVEFRSKVLASAGSFELGATSVRRHRLAAVAEPADDVQDAPEHAATPVVPLNPRQV
jgi:flagellar protein FlbD